jgi:hypothetical protein
MPCHGSSGVARQQRHAGDRGDQAEPARPAYGPVGASPRIPPPGQPGQLIDTARGSNPSSRLAARGRPPRHQQSRSTGRRDRLGPAHPGGDQQRPGQQAARPAPDPTRKASATAPNGEPSSTPATAAPTAAPRGLGPASVAPSPAYGVVPGSRPAWGRPGQTRTGRVGDLPGRGESRALDPSPAAPSAAHGRVGRGLRAAAATAGMPPRRRKGGPRLAPGTRRPGRHRRRRRPPSGRTAVVPSRGGPGHGPGRDTGRCTSTTEPATPSPAARPAAGNVQADPHRVPALVRRRGLHPAQQDRRVRGQQRAGRGCRKNPQPPTTPLSFRAARAPAGAFDQSAST